MSDSLKIDASMAESPVEDLIKITGGGVTDSDFSFLDLNTSLPLFTDVSINANGLTASATMAPNVYISTGTGYGYGANVADLETNNTLSLSGTNADIVINGVSLTKTLQDIQDRLQILKPNLELEKEWDQLRKLREKYQKLEQKCMEKSKMWTKLKSMPPPEIS